MLLFLKFEALWWRETQAGKLSLSPLQMSSYSIEIDENFKSRKSNFKFFTFGFKVFNFNFHSQTLYRISNQKPLRPSIWKNKTNLTLEKEMKKF